MKHAFFTAKGQPIDTAKWDTVSAIHISELNEAIRIAGTTPKTFKHEADQGTDVSAGFGAWEILPDSDGPTLSMKLPLKDVVIREAGETRTYETAAAIVDVHLELLPHDPDSTDNKCLNLLVVKIAPDRESKHAAHVTKVLIEGHHSVVDEVYVSTALEQWLDDNLGDFTQVFATINIHKIVVETEAFAWLKPTHVAYAFGYDALEPENSVLGVLCQTGGRSADGLIYQIQADVIPEGSKVAYVISKSRYLRDMLAGALPRAFEGMKAKNIKIAKDESGLSITKPVQLKEVESDGKKYDPKLLEFEIALNETEINVFSITKTKIFPGIFSICTSIGHYGFGLTDRKSGGKTLGYFETRPFESQYTTEKSKGAIITEIILGIIAAVAAVILWVVSGGASTAVMVALYVALAGSMGTLTVMEIAELVRENDGPPVDMLVANATDAVTWATGSQFDPVVAGLNGALQIGGNFVEDPSLNADGPKMANLSPPQAVFQEKFATRMKERSL